MKNRFAPLFSATPDALGGNGAAASGETANAAPLAVVTAEAAAGDDAPAAPAAAAEAETKPGYLETIRASLQSKASLLSERDTFLARATAAEAQLKDAKDTITTLTAERDTLRSEKAEIEKMVSELSTEKATVELAAAREVAAMGFDAAKLPAPESGDGNSMEALEAQLEKETDPQQIVILARKIDARKAKGAA
jgi:chromosome segregation ATPase